MSNESSPEKSPWGWKALVIAFILSAFFLGFFYLAVTNEPDYMPSQQNQQNTQQHAFKKAPAMSEEALNKAQADKQARENQTSNPASETAESHNMSADEHAHMSNMQHEENTAHGH
jgi:hypothetical protein